MLVKLRPEEEAVRGPVDVNDAGGVTEKSDCLLDVALRVLVLASKTMLWQLLQKAGQFDPLLILLYGPAF